MAHREAALERLGKRLEVRGGTVASAAIALVLHVGVLLTALILALLGEMWTWHSALLAKLQVRILDEYQVDIVKDEEPPPPPEPEPPKVEEPKPETPPPPTEKAVEPPPQAAAQAAKVLTAEPAKDEPLDMTNVMVQGTADTYAGGTTSGTGTGKGPVRGPAAPTGGTTGGTGNVGTQTAGVDKSRKASLSGSSDWDCPFPPEADAVQEDLAYVNIRVAIGADGRPTKVTVVKDPGHGFAREARTCAMQKKFLPALDSSGAPVGSENEYRVRFER